MKMADGAIDKGKAAKSMAKILSCLVASSDRCLAIHHMHNATKVPAKMLYALRKTNTVA
jgi:hypothetical protein